MDRDLSEAKSGTRVASRERSFGRIGGARGLGRWANPSLKRDDNKIYDETLTTIVRRRDAPSGSQEQMKCHSHARGLLVDDHASSPVPACGFKRFPTTKAAYPTRSVSERNLTEHGSSQPHQFTVPCAMAQLESNRSRQSPPPATLLSRKM